MAIELQVILNPGEEDALIIDEPIGLDSLEISLKRDDKLHGMQFEASTSALEFYGRGALYLQDHKNRRGVKAKVTMEVLTSCEDSYDFETLLFGRLNFGKFKDTCGATCKVLIPWEEDSCALILKSRYEQKVDLDKMFALDNVTPLAYYAGAGTTIMLEPVSILLENRAEVNQPITFDLRDDFLWDQNETPNIMRNNSSIPFNLIINSSFGAFSTDITPTLYGREVASNFPPEPTMPATVDTTSIIGDIQCNFSDVSLNWRIKGSVTQTRTSTSVGTTTGFNLRLFRIKAGEDYETPADWEMVFTVNLGVLTNEDQIEFDHTHSMNFPDAAQGDRYVLVYNITSTPALNVATFVLTQDTETFFTMSGSVTCEATPVDAYLIHEALSRVTEAITNNCVRVKSEFYGRTDSQPFSFLADGCGGLRMITSGLKIRQAEEDKCFVSLKDLVEGLLPIDNIGMAIEPDTIPGKSLLRIEGLDYFYQDVELLRLDAVPRVTGEVEESRHYARIEVGYPKWEVQRVNGLKEFNSTREYRTSIDTLQNTLDLKSNFVTGSYPIEITRQQSFAITGAADTTYDNETFLIALFRGGYAYSELQVEQGNILHDQNIFSPQTIYNWRLRPIANLMRWYRSIAAGYPNIVDTDNKLFFNSGTGNIVATGEQSSVFCKPEKGVTIENQDISSQQIDLNPTPLWKNETVSMEYPLSLNDYNKIKANPYGFISYQCGNGEWEQGWIKEIKYRPLKGTATFILRKRWLTQ